MVNLVALGSRVGRKKKQPWETLKTTDSQLAAREQKWRWSFTRLRSTVIWTPKGLFREGSLLSWVHRKQKLQKINIILLLVIAESQTDRKRGCSHNEAPSYEGGFQGLGGLYPIPLRYYFILCFEFIITFLYSFQWIRTFKWFPYFYTTRLKII